MKKESEDSEKEKVPKVPFKSHEGVEKNIARESGGLGGCGPKKRGEGTSVPYRGVMVPIGL